MDSASNNTVEEISLIDLIAVLIKRRRLILGITLSSLLIGVVVLFLLPMADIYFYTPSTRYVVQRVIELPVLPNDIQQYFSVAPERIIAIKLGDPFFIADEYERVMISKNGMNETEYFTFLKNTVIGRQLTSSYQANQNTYTIRFSHLDEVMARQLISEVTAKLRQEVLIAYQEAMELVNQSVAAAVVATLADMETLPLPLSALDIRPLSELNLSLERSSRLIAQASFPWRTTAPVVYTETEGAGRSLVFVLIVMAAIFISFFLAFLLEYAERVRNDEVEMEKLRSAWNWRRR